MARRPPGWKVVEHVIHKKFLNGGVIMVEDDPDVIHVDNSSGLALSTSLNDLEIAALHIDGQSIDVDSPPHIIDVVDEDDDIIDVEDPIPHDLVDSDDEDLVNLDIDDGVNMSTDVAWGHGGDGGGDDRPPPYQVPTGCGGCLGNRGKGTRKPNLGGRREGRQHTRQETRDLRLKAITDKSGPVPIRFEVDDRETLMPLGDYAAHWANYLGELVRELPLHYPSWLKMPPERKAGVVGKIGRTITTPESYLTTLQRLGGLPRELSTRLIPNKRRKFYLYSWKLLKTQPRGYRNTIELPEVNNVVLLRSDTIRKYKEKMLFDVVDTDACHIILGKPWVYDLNAIYKIEDNTYKFKHNGGRFILVPLMESNHVSEQKWKNSFNMGYQDLVEERKDEFLVNSTITTTRIQDETSMA
nr:reverse transcriptase [Tanacetum cinerariifolium]